MYEFKLKLERESVQLLKEMEQKIPKNVLDTAAYKGVAPIFDAAQALAPLGPPKRHRKYPNTHLKNAFVHKRSKRMKWVGKAFVAVNRKPELGGAPHEHLVAFGTVGRRKATGKGGKFIVKKDGKRVPVMMFKIKNRWVVTQEVGPMPKNPFWEIAIRRHTNSGFTLAEKHLLRYVERKYKINIS